jgi:hypothetical protein
MSNYVGISPPRVREFAAIVGGAGDDARALALEADGLLADAQLTSSGPALASDIALTMAAAARVLNQRATIADLCRTDPGALGAELEASRLALRALLIDDQGVSLLDDTLSEPTDAGEGPDVLDQLWDLLGTGSSISSLTSELKAAARLGILFRLRMSAIGSDAARLLEYLGPLAQTAQGRRILAYLTGSEATAGELADSVAKLGAKLSKLSAGEALTAVGEWFVTTYPRLASATKAVGTGATVFFSAIEAVEAIDALRQGHVGDALDHALYSAAGVLLLVNNPVAIGVGAVILAGLLVFENREWIKRHLSLDGLIDLGETVLDGVDTAIDVTVDAVGNAVKNGARLLNPFG